MAAGLGAGTGVAAVVALAASSSARTVARAAARSLRPGLFVGVGLQGSWSEFLVFDLVCGIDLWIGSYGGESKGGIFRGFGLDCFPDFPVVFRLAEGYDTSRWMRYKSWYRYDMIRFESVSV